MLQGASPARIAGAMVSLPVGEMGRAGDLPAGRRAIQASKASMILVGDAVARHDLRQEERFGEGAAEVLPHRPDDRLALVGRQEIRQGGGDVVERAAMALQPGGYEPPEGARHRGGALETERPERCGQPRVKARCSRR